VALWRFVGKQALGNDIAMVLCEVRPDIVKRGVVFQAPLVELKSALSLIEQF
jgi:hypothetical protein